MMSRFFTLVACGLFGASLMGCAEAAAEGSVADARFPEPAAAANSELVSENSLAAQAPGREVHVGADDDATYSDADPAALRDFREPLSPYGVWVDDSAYGTVWVPHAHVVGPEFVPYSTAGHWAYGSEYVWVSDYEWGWAPFHYGRWVHIPARGWAWIPGRVYSGAWVTWRVGPVGYGYVGWAPMAPSWYWYYGYPVGFAYGPSVTYVYCPTHDLFAPTVAHHVVRGEQAAVVAGPTQPYTPPRTAASPTVDARTPAVARTGPDPSALGIPQTKIATAPTDNAGLRRASAFSSPKTAVPMGASPPGVAAYKTDTAPANRPLAAPRDMSSPMRSASSVDPTVPREMLPRSDSAMPRHDSSAVATAPRSVNSLATAPRWDGARTSPTTPVATAGPQTRPSFGRIYSSPGPTRAEAPTSYPMPRSQSPSYSEPRYSPPSSQSYSRPSTFSSPSQPTYSAPRFSSGPSAQSYSRPSTFSAPASSPVRSSSPSVSTPARSTVSSARKR